MRGKSIITRGMQTYWRWTRALTMGAQGVVLRGDREVLLVRHGYRAGWHFPGGGVEKNETVLSALARELGEEAGVELRAEPRLFGLYANFTSFKSDHIALFVAREWTQPAIPAPNHEIAEVGHFPVDALPVGTIGPVRRRLAEILDGAPVSPHW